MTKQATTENKKDEIVENKQVEKSEEAGDEVSEEKVKKVTEKHKKSTASKIKELENQLREQQDKYLRLSADFDNYRKRALKEKIELTKYAGEELMFRILPVIDDFERALGSMENVQDTSTIKEGIILIYNKFKDWLIQQGIEEINAMHQDFNTDHHEAVTKFPAPDESLKGKVLDVIEKGYKLNDKVIRYAKVVVGE